jgi:hypothetical protein
LLAFGKSETRFESVTTDGSVDIYAAGCIAGTESYDFGDGVSARGAASLGNCVLVKYKN